MSKIFDFVPVSKPKRNKFDLSHERKLTMNMGYLYPVLCQEVVPGDKFRVNSQVFLRFLALIAPVMHRIDVTMHYFFVPNRLIWSNWEDFITGGRDGLAAPVPPQFKIADVAGVGQALLRTGGLLDHLGFPVMKTANSVNSVYNNLVFNALPIRAYLLIYDTYYRDQNVELTQLSSTFKSDGLVSAADILQQFAIRPRAWEKDYLTSCLPWAQRGNPVSIPITSGVTYRKPALLRQASNDALQVSKTVTAGASVTDASGAFIGGISGGPTTYLDNIASIDSSSLTVNALRSSLRLQEWLEKNARGGGRYIEQIAAHFGVISSDARLQRPEYLGGGKQPVVISQNLQTAPATGGSTPLSTLSGYGVSVGSTNQFSKFFEEHGFIMGILSVMPRTAYQQAMPKLFTRLVNTDYYFPEFAHLGEQAVIGAEVYSDFSDAASVGSFGATFGYQSRHADYKYVNSTVHGQMRESLSYWHMGRSFTAAPALGTTFVQAGNSVRTDIFAVTTDVDHLVCQIFHSISALRPMPYFSSPRL